MAYINGRIEHEYLDIQIEILEPRKGESNFGEGMQVQVSWDTMLSTSLDEFRRTLKWMLEKADYIEQTFAKDGKAKTITIKG